VPLEIEQLLRSHPDLVDVVIERAIPEHQIRFDDLRGEPRNADLAVEARDRNGVIAITIEGKADESFDRPVSAVLRSAVERIGADERTGAVRRVLAEKDNYIVRVLGEDVVGVVEVKRVQWYQCEISHLSVDPRAQGAGIGTSLVEDAERRTREMGGRISQRTIRVGNAASEAVFTKRGFVPAALFRNERTGNEVRVYQKVVD